MSDAGDDESAAAQRLLQGVRNALHARRLKALAPAQAVEQALGDYCRAIELTIVDEYAREHNLPRQASNADPGALARALLAAVQALPQLASGQRAASGTEAGPSAAPPSAPALPAATRQPSARTDAAAPTEPTEPTEPSVWTALELATERAPLVLVGGVAHLERLDFAPRHFVQRVEWIDTTRQGTHAIGNLAQRIRAGRVTALVLLEGTVGHRHSEPLVHAAREANVPVAFAGKGARAALLRAFEKINAKL